MGFVTILQYVRCLQYMVCRLMTFVANRLFRFVCYCGCDSLQYLACGNGELPCAVSREAHGVGRHPVVSVPGGQPPPLSSALSKGTVEQNGEGHCDIL